MTTRALMIAIFFVHSFICAASESEETASVKTVTVADLVRTERISLHSPVGIENTSGEAYLRLNECGLTSLYGLETLHEIQRVQQLDIRYNELSTLTREDMACMPHLKYLYANNNQLEHIAEDTFAENPRLIGISLSHNKLQDASAIVRVFTQLQFIDLACNKLPSFKPPVANPALQFCNVAHNPGQFGEPDTGTLLLRCRQLRRFGDVATFCTEEYYNLKRST